MSYILDNQDAMREDEAFQGGEGSYEYQVLDSLLERIKESSQIPCSGGTVLVFDDEDPNELVYGIAANDCNKRITVSFRGTSTTTDMTTDVKYWMEEVENPYNGATENQKQYIYMHQGFYGESTIISW